MDNLSTAHKLIPIARALMQQSQSDAPNYRAASGLNRCATCVHFVRATFCDLYEFNADPDFICDSWRRREPDVGELRAMIEQAWPGLVERAGARHSRGDNRMLQDIHDAAVNLGAVCPTTDE